jgi:hypothetical protein
LFVALEREREGKLQRERERGTQTQRENKNKKEIKNKEKKNKENKNLGYCKDFFCGWLRVCFLIGEKEISRIWGLYFLVLFWVFWQLWHK